MMTEEVSETQPFRPSDSYDEDADGLMAISAASVNETQPFSSDGDGDLLIPDTQGFDTIQKSPEQRDSRSLDSTGVNGDIGDGFAVPAPKSPREREETDSSFLANNVAAQTQKFDVNETQGFVSETQPFDADGGSSEGNRVSPAGSTPVRDEEIVNEEPGEMVADVPLSTQGFVPEEIDASLEGTQDFETAWAGESSVNATQGIENADRPQSPVPPESERVSPAGADTSDLKPLKSPPPSEDVPEGAVGGSPEKETEEPDDSHLFDNQDLFSSNQPMDPRARLNSDESQEETEDSQAIAFQETPNSPELDESGEQLGVDSTQAFEIPADDDALEQELPKSAEELIEELNKLEGETGEGGGEAQPTEGEARELISNIFDEHDDSEDEGFEGFGAEDVEKAKETEQAEAAALSDAEDEARDQARRNIPEDFEYDFEKMMRLKKEQNRKRRRRKRGQDVDFINDHDEIITGLIAKMHEAAKDDRHSNENQKPGLQKRKLLPTVLEVIRKRDVQDALIDNGILNAISDWLSPLPDRSLPAYEIRTEFLKILTTFPTPEPDSLKSSSLGKTVMILCKHPKESKDNKRTATKLINTWARQIFDIKADYAALSKEDREQRDYEHMTDAKKRRLSSDARPQGAEGGDEETVLRPGDKGWIGRARVPAPSSKDYVVRPKWNVEGPVNKERRQKKPVSFMDKKMREFKERTRQAKAVRATNISINGTRMK